MDQNTNSVAARSFAEAFAAALSASFLRTTGSAWPLQIADSQDPPPRDAQPAQFRMRLEGRLSGECYVEFYEPQLSEILAKLGGVSSREDVANRARLLAPVLTASAADMKSALAANFGELTFKTDAVSGLACGGMFVVPLRPQSDRPSLPSVFLYFDGKLLAALSSASGGTEASDARQQAIPNNLRLVMDVELNVSLRFGQRQLPLREVLELTSGSVIELDKMVDEPVEMLLDGKVVARGEAVIVDGNYGLHITEIPQSIESHLQR